MEKHMSKIRSVLKMIRRRLFMQRLLQTEILSLLVGVILPVPIMAAACFIPVLHLWRYPALLVSLALLAGFILTLLRYPSEMDGARAADGRGLKERTITALEEEKNPGPFGELIAGDALTQLKKIKVKEAFPVKPAGREIRRLKWTGAMLVLMLVLGLVPTEAKERAGVLAVVQEEAKKAQAELVQKAEQQKEEALTREEAEGYEALMEQLKDELKAADTEKMVKETLERGEMKLEQMKEAASLAASLGAALENISGDDQSLGNGSSGDQSGKGQAGEEKTGDGPENETGTGKYTPEELAEMAEMKAALEAAMASGSISSELLESAGATCQAAGIGQQVAGIMNGQTGEGGQSGSSGQTGKNALGSSGQSGNSGQSGAGSSGQQSGQGGGSGRGGGMNYGGPEGQEQALSGKGELVCIPNETGDDGNLTGSVSGQAIYTANGSQVVTWAGEPIPYDQVITSYTDQAIRNLSGRDYPARLQDRVKAYFEGLNQ